MNSPNVSLVSHAPLIQSYTAYRCIHSKISKPEMIIDSRRVSGLSVTLQRRSDDSRMVTHVRPDKIRTMSHENKEPRLDTMVRIIFNCFGID